MSNRLFLTEPGWAAAYIDLEGDIELDSGRHFIAYPLCMFIGFGAGQLENELIVDLKD